MTISIEDSIDKEKSVELYKREDKYMIDPLILNRWSPRSITGEELDDETIMSLFEAARWGSILL